MNQDVSAPLASSTNLEWEREGLFRKQLGLRDSELRRKELRTREQPTSDVSLER